MTTHTRLAAFFLLIAAPVSASSSLAAHFHPSEEQHVVGGPVFVVFNLVNHSAQPLAFKLRTRSPLARVIFSRLMAKSERMVRATASPDIPVDPGHSN